MRAIAVVRRRDGTIVVEVQVVRAAAARRGRPIRAAVTDTVEAAILVVVANTRSRIPDGTCGTKLAGEVHTLVGTVI